jgi:single-stranded DNA-specific DHH superfamily exonuclease
MFNQELLRRFQEYIKAIKKDDKIALMFHADTDGVCSAVLIAKTIERMAGRKVDYYFTQNSGYNLSEETVKILKDGGFNKYIIVDQAIDNNPVIIKEIEKFADVLILDHHQITNDVNSDKTVFINVANITTGMDGSTYPASKLIYDLCLTLTDVKDLDWVACVGLIGDMQFKIWEKFVNDTLNKYNKKITPNGPQNVFGRITNLINTARVYNPENIIECYDIVYNAGSFEDIFDSKLKDYQEEVKAEMNTLVKGFSNVKGENGLFIYEIKPRFNINSTLSTVLSMDYISRDNTLIVIADNGEDKISVSARRQDKKSNMGKLMNLCVSGIAGCSGGGHVPAAGAVVPKAEITKFKNNLIKIYNENNGIIQ